MTNHSEVEVKVDLTEEEMKETADNLTLMIEERNDLELEKKEVVEGFNRKIKGREETINELSNKYRKGYEIKQYTCDVKLVPEERKRQYIDIDTGEIVKEEDLQPDELL